MKIRYDAEVDALYIQFREASVTTKELGEGIAVDFDAEGHLAGVEILDAVARLGQEHPFREITLEDIALTGAN